MGLDGPGSVKALIIWVHDSLEVCTNYFIVHVPSSLKTYQQVRLYPMSETSIFLLSRLGTESFFSRLLFISRVLCLWHCSFVYVPTSSWSNLVSLWVVRFVCFNKLLLNLSLTVCTIQRWVVTCTKLQNHLP